MIDSRMSTASANCIPDNLVVTHMCPQIGEDLGHLSVSPHPVFQV